MHLLCSNENKKIKLNRVPAVHDASSKISEKYENTYQVRRAIEVILPTFVDTLPREIASMLTRSFRDIGNFLSKVEGQGQK